METSNDNSNTSETSKEEMVNNAELSEEKTEEDIQRRHRLEKKELQATIQKIKKGINNCKKKKKEAATEITKLENEMKERHEQELLNFQQKISVKEITEKISDLDVEENDSVEPETHETTQKVSRAAKRRAKKAEAAQTREAELKKEKQSLLMNSPRSIEMKKMAKIFEERKLSVKDIAPDGNCMYAALSHQLNGSHTMENLRNIASDYMMQNEQEFQPFLTDPDTGDMLTSESYKSYCSDIANTAAWGGQPELSALSQSLKRRIQVVQATGPDIILGESYHGDALLLAYYRHAYSLGEHYNSLMKQPEEGS